MNPRDRGESHEFPDPIDLPESEWNELDEIVARFEHAWKESPRPNIAQFLPAGNPQRLAVLLELVRVDFECRCRAREERNPWDYFSQFPELAAHEGLAYSLIAAEERLDRLGSGVEPGPDLQATKPPGGSEHSTTTSGPGTSSPDERKLTRAGRPVPAGPAFDDRYEILGEIGRGGMGVVYRVHDRRRNQIVALKALQWVDPRTLYRFKREFRILADVAHPNLITLYELFSDGQMWCFTMEYVDGDDFLTHVTDYAHVPFAGAGQSADPSRPDARVRAPRLAPGAPLTADALERLRRALPQLVGAISFLHNAGKLHRDIKPQNILVTRQNRVVLLDFGLMAEMERAGLHESSIRHVVGTRAYMSPEQAAAHPISPASDWYSVGVMMYKALTGRLPFEGTAQEISREKQARDAIPPRELAPWIPDDLNDLCVDLLRRVPADRPAGEEILRRLGHEPDEIKGTRTNAAQASLEGCLIGREPHLRALDDAFQSVVRGRTVAVYVQGRSGAGKTALIQAFLDDREQRGGSVILRGKCYEQESMPYKALDSVIDSLSLYLGRLLPIEVEVLLPRDIVPVARLFPVLRRVATVAKMQRAIETPDPHELRRRAIAGLRELLGRIGDRLPLLLVIDDLQWGDADSAAVLAELLRPPDPPILLLIAGFRSEDLDQGPLPTVLAQLHEQTGDSLERRMVCVEALSSELARELAVALLAESDSDLTRHAAAVADESGGNPFFLHELVRHVATQSDLAAGVDPEHAIALDEIIFNRVQSLPGEARKVLEVVAVGGRPLLQQEAFAAADLPADHAGILALLRSDHLLRSTGAGDATLLETYHDRVREAIVGRLPEHRLLSHHQRLADTLERSPTADPEEVAGHFQAAANLGKACEHFGLAAERAADALAFQRAAGLFKIALSLYSGAADRGRALRVKLADALANAGRGVDAAIAYLDAASVSGQNDGAVLRGKAALQFLISGHVDEGTSLLREALSAAGIWYPRTSRRAILGLLVNRSLLRIKGLSFGWREESRVASRILQKIDTCWAAVSGLSLVDFLRAEYFQSRQMRLALQAGEPRRVLRALSVEVAHSATAGEAARERIDGLIAVAERLAQQLGDPYSAAVTKMGRGLSDALCGRWCSSQQYCEQSAEIFRTACSGANWEQDTLHRFVAWSLVQRGQMTELNRRLPVLIQGARERGNLYAETNFSTFVIPMMHLAADQPQRAREELQESMDRWSKLGSHDQPLGVQHATRVYDEALIDMYLDNGGSARERLRTFWPVFVRSHLIRICQLRIFMVDARARSALRSASTASFPEDPLQFAERDAVALSREHDAWAKALSLLISAGVSAFRGHSDKAVTFLRKAIDACEALDMSLHAAAARVRLGSLLLGDEGQLHSDAGTSWMASQKIQDVPRMTSLIAPGFREHVG